MADHDSDHPSGSSPDKGLLTIKQAAEALGCCRNTVDNLITAGRLPYVQVGVKKGHRIDPKDLEDYIGAHKYRYAGPKPPAPKTQLRRLL